MIIHEVTQGTTEWQALRASCFTASEAPAMAGVSKYQSRSDLLKQKYTGEVPEVSAAQQRLFDKGHAAEAKARPIAERILSEELYPCTATHDDHKCLLASFDGCTMLEDVIFEHKLINDELRTATVETLPEHYKVQMDQQLLVSGAEKCLFMASDGTEEDCNWFWYETTPKRIASLVAGWEQFKADLEAYQPQAQKVAPQGKAPDQLPALSIQMTGGVQASNLPDFKAQALAMIDGIKTELVTDRDFADAESTVKFLQKGEKQLEESKQQALEQTASIAELFDTIDELRETMRQKRLHLNKLVKAEKENRRIDIQRKAFEAFDAFLATLECPIEPAHSLDIAGAMKGKKTISTLQAAADDEVARAKVECQQLADQINANRKIFDQEHGEYGFLFADWRELIQKQPDDLRATIKARIAERQEVERQRPEAERARIRQEEEVKAKREAEEAARKPKPKPEPEPEPLPAAAERAAQEEQELPSEIKPAELVTITRQEYDRLLRAEAKLMALEDYGVAHWHFYDDAMQRVKAA